MDSEKNVIKEKNLTKTQLSVILRCTPSLHFRCGKPTQEFLVEAIMKWKGNSDCSAMKPYIV